MLTQRRQNETLIEDRISARAAPHGLSPSHICMINTSNNINSPSSARHRTHAHIHVYRAAHAHTDTAEEPKSFQECMRGLSLVLPSPSWLIYQTALASRIPEA